MNELLQDLKNKQSKYLQEYQEKITTLLKPLENHLFLSSKFVYEEAKDDMLGSFHILIIGSSEDNQYLLVSEHYTKIHQFTIEFDVTKRDVNQKQAKIIRIANLSTNYVTKSYDNNDILDLLYNQNYLKTPISNYSDMNEIISNIFEDNYKLDNENKNWFKIGYTTTQFSRSDFKREVLFHQSLMNTIKQALENRVEKIRLKEFHSSKDFEFLENKIQNEYLKENLLNDKPIQKKMKL